MFLRNNYCYFLWFNVCLYLEKRECHWSQTYGCYSGSHYFLFLVKSLHIYKSLNYTLKISQFATEMRSLLIIRSSASSIFYECNYIYFRFQIKFYYNYYKSASWSIFCTLKLCKDWESMHKFYWTFLTDFGK